MTQDCLSFKGAGPESSRDRKERRTPDLVLSPLDAVVVGVQRGREVKYLRRGRRLPWRLRVSERQVLKYRTLCHSKVSIHARRG